MGLMWTASELNDAAALIRVKLEVDCGARGPEQHARHLLRREAGNLAPNHAGVG